LHAEGDGVERSECEPLIEAASIKLLLRLLHDCSWQNLPALAAGIVRACLAEPRCAQPNACFPLRPQPRLVVVKAVPSPQGQHMEGVDDDESC
jgi:hypothetical protein